MGKERGEKLRNIYGIFLSLLTVVVGASFIWQTWSIYRAAEQSPYTVERISEHYNQISAFVWLWLAAFLGSVILTIAFPVEKQRPKAYQDVATILARTKARMPKDRQSVFEMQEVSLKEEKFRKITAIVYAAALSLIGLFCLGILLDITYLPWIKAEFFTAHGAAVDKITQVAAFSLLGLIAACIGVRLFTCSRKKELDAYREIMKQAKQRKPEEEEPASRWQGVIEGVADTLLTDGKKAKKRLSKELDKAIAPSEQKATAAELAGAKAKKRKLTVLFVRIGVAVVGCGLIVWGVSNGGMKDVLLKAINICTQCIGLG